MRQDYEKLFSNIQLTEPPAGLFDKIISRIYNERNLMAVRRRVVIFSIGFAGSVIALAPAFLAVRTGLAESGFAYYFSLLFSDFNVVAAYWQNFALALLEALPITSMALLLGIIFVFLGSLRFLSKNIKGFYHSKQFLTP